MPSLKPCVIAFSAERIARYRAMRLMLLKNWPILLVASTTLLTSLPPKCFGKSINAPLIAPKGMRVIALPKSETEIEDFASFSRKPANALVAFFILLAAFPISLKDSAVLCADSPAFRVSDSIVFMPEAALFAELPVLPRAAWRRLILLTAPAALALSSIDRLSIPSIFHRLHFLASCYLGSAPFQCLGVALAFFRLLLLFSIALRYGPRLGWVGVSVTGVLAEPL